MSPNPTPADIEDCTEVCGDDVSLDLILEDLDMNNKCTDPGGHVWLAENGGARCIYCKTDAMPVKASREAT